MAMRSSAVIVALLVTTSVGAGADVGSGAGLVPAPAPAPAPTASTIGSVALALGASAFATAVTCRDADGCGASITHLSAPPELAILSMNRGLTAAHVLDVVATDLFVDDVVRLRFSVPIKNGAGPDLYLAQAEFLGQRLSDAVGVNDFGISLDGGATWWTVAGDAFARDDILPPVTVWFSDPEPTSDAYHLWFATVDLSAYGVAGNAAISGLDIRGVPRTGGRGTEGLDVVTVANLNAPLDQSE